MADVSVSLGLNAAELYSELQSSLSKFQQKMAGFAQSTGTVTAAHEKLLTSSHRVASQIRNVTSQLASGASAAEVMGTAIEGLGRSLNLPLGTLAGLAVVGVLAEQIFKTRSEAAKLNDELDRINQAGHVSSRLESIEAIKTRLDETKKKYEELQKSHDSYLNTVLRGLARLGGASKEDTDEGFSARKKETRKTIKRETGALIEKDKESIDIEGKKLNEGDIAAERAKIEQKRHEAITAAQDLPGKKNRALAIENANREAAIAKAEVDRKEAAGLRSAALEERLTQIKRAGKDVDVESAKAKAAYAQEVLKAAKAEDIPKATAELHQSLVDLEETKRKQADILSAAKDKTAVDRLSAAGEKELANLLKIELDYQKQIVDAKRAGNDQLAAELGKQKELAVAEQARADAKQQIANEASDVRKPEDQFRRENYEEHQNAADRRAVAKAEAKVYADETSGRPRTLSEQAKLGALEEESSSPRGDLQAERRALLRKVAQGEEIKELNKGTASESQGLGSLGNEKQAAAYRRIEQIDNILHNLDAERDAREREQLGQNRAADAQAGAQSPLDQSGKELTGAAQELKSAAEALKGAVTNQ